MIELEGLEESVSESRSLEETTREETRTDPFILAPPDYWGSEERVDFGSSYWGEEGPSGRLLKENGIFIYVDTELSMDGSPPKGTYQVYNFTLGEWGFAEVQGLQSYLEDNNRGNYLHTPEELSLVADAKIAAAQGTATLLQRSIIDSYNRGVPVDWNHYAKWFYAYGYDESLAKLVLYLDAASPVLGEATSVGNPRRAMNNLKSMNQGGKKNSASADQTISNQKSSSKAMPKKRRNSLDQKRAQRTKKHRKT
jgi:hypothetical protein